MPAIKEKIKIGGIKLSSELVQINFQNLPDIKKPASLLCRILSQNNINTPFFSFTRQPEKNKISCCVETEDITRTTYLLESDPDLKGKAEFVPSVGLLSVFPHRSSLKILGLSLYALAQARLSVHGLASSVSSLTIVTDYVHLDRGAVSLAKHLGLPPDYTPLKPEIRVTQSRVVKKNELCWTN